jgi:hypothetical protein
MLYILKSCWYDIIVLNVHDPTEGKIDDMKDSFYDELALHGSAWCSCFGDICCLHDGGSMYQ